MLKFKKILPAPKGSWTPRRGWEDNIKMCYQVIGWRAVDYSGRVLDKF